MKKIVACSRLEVRNVLARLEESTIVISIHDPDHKPEFTEDEQLPHVCGILSVPFWDEVSDEHGCITHEQAEHIACFVLRLGIFATNIVVNCEGGVSRSAGVAAALSVFFNGDDSNFFDRRGKYVPNMTCYRRVLECLMMYKADMRMHAEE